MTALFVAHDNRPEGLKRTRRLFTTLNKTAKRVSKKDIIALDEDDYIAVITRRLIDDYPLFSSDKLTTSGSKNIPISDTTSFTNIITLYDCVHVYFGSPNAARRIWQDYSIVDESYTQAVALWETMCRHFEPLQELLTEPSASVVPRYRNRDGGHLLFRPVGLVLVVRVVRYLMDEDVTLDAAVARIAAVPLLLGLDPWVGVLWDPINHRMVTGATNQNVGAALLLYLVGGDLRTAKTDRARLTNELAGILNRSVEDMALPDPYVLE